MSSISITSESHARQVEHLSRLLARRVALGLALSRGEMKDAARAAGRTRLPELGLSQEERHGARFARATLGRAIRDARARTLRAPVLRPVVRSTAIALPRRSRRRLAMFAALATAVGLLIVVLLLGQPGGPLSGVRAPGSAGTASSQQVLDQTKQSRGRTTSFTQKVSVGAPVATPAPAVGPSDRERGEFGGGGGGGGNGSGGSGTGGVGVAPVAPVVPLVTPVPSGYVRFHGRVFDATTGAPVPGVCIIIGSLDCGADKPWDFGWQKIGFRPYATRLFSFGSNDVPVQDIRLNH